MGKHLGTQKSIRFTEEELKELEAAKMRHGSYKAAIMAGIRKDAGAAEPTNDELLAYLQKRLSH